jgi:methionyl-tRNA formyltransferase
VKAIVFAYSNVGDRCLRVLRARGVEVPLVVTHRDQPGETIWFRRVAETAEELGLPVLYSDDPANPALQDAVEAAAPDFIFSFYWRLMLPRSVLAAVPRGAFNMHGSLLPRYRGRAPTNWAVLHGETETGATLHEMIAKPDAGRIVDQQSVPILPDDTAMEVFDKVTVASEQVLWRALPAIIRGQIDYRPNDLAQGSYFGARRPEDGRIDWMKPARQVYALIRAVAPPYPGAFTDIGGTRVIVSSARLSASPSEIPVHERRPGLHVADGRVVAICGDGGVIAIRELRAAGEPLAPDVLKGLLDSQRIECATR